MGPISNMSHLRVNLCRIRDGIYRKKVVLGNPSVLIINISPCLESGADIHAPQVPWQKGTESCL